MAEKISVEMIRSKATQLAQTTEQVVGKVSSAAGQAAEKISSAAALLPQAAGQAKEKISAAAEEMTEKIDIETALRKATQLPYVRIHRDKFLDKQFSKKVAPDQLQAILDKGAPAAGVSIAVIDKTAKDCITNETARVTGLSAAAGVPGGLAMIGTIPADVVQYFGHVLRVAQKLAYLYGWPDLSENNEGEEQFDDGTMNLLMLFIGVMFGVQAATTAVSKIAAQLASQVPKQLVKQALTKGTIYPIVKQVAKQLGIKMTKEIFAQGVGKVIPVVGGAVSGGLTIATFLPMSNRLRKHLSEIANNIVATEA